MDTVLVSLIVAGNSSVPAEHILLELVLDLRQSDIVPGVRSHYSGKGFNRGELLGPVEFITVNINQNTKILKEILSDNHIIRAQL
jgi:hypothetical protein